MAKDIDENKTINESIDAVIFLIIVFKQAAAPPDSLPGGFLYGILNSYETTFF